MSKREVAAIHRERVQPLPVAKDVSLGPALTIVIPAYNEAPAIRSTVESLLSVAEDRLWQVLVIDDGSTDGTSDVLADLAASHPALRVITHQRNRGYGAALKTGIRYADAPYVATMDSDGQHTIEQLLSLLPYAQDHEVIIGQRVGLIHSKPSRMPGKWLLGMIANYLSKEHIPDLNSGLRIFHTKVIRRYVHLCSNGFSFSTTSTLILLNRGYALRYVPIKVQSRQGRSTVTMRTGINTIMLILRLSMLLDPLRIFLPISVLSILLGAGWAIPYLIARQGLTVASLLFIMNGAVIFLVGLLADQVAELRKGQFEEPARYDT